MRLLYGRLCGWLIFTLMLLSTAALAAGSLPVSKESPVTVTVFVGGKPVAFVVSPYLAADGQVYMPVDVVRLMGGSYTPSADGRSVTVTTSGGDQVVMACEYQQARYVVALAQYAGRIGAVADWDPVHNELRLRAALRDVQLDQDGKLRIDAGYPVHAQVSTLSGPDRLIVDVPGLDLSSDAAQPVPADPDVIDIRTGRLTEDITRIVLDMRRPVTYQVAANTAGGSVEVDLAPPAPPSTPGEPESPIMPAATGSLVGKIVMIDPGHGGQDSGAQSLDKTVDEKDIVLSLGLKLRDILARDGAVVYMTRGDDTFPRLKDRGPMANAAQADYFISLHCNFVGIRNKASGTIVWYHADNPAGSELARCIIARVSAVSGIPSGGYRSDLTRYSHLGFEVLRDTTMPSVLIEYGFLDNDQDLATMLDPNAQQRAAEGIAAGLLDYVAEQQGQARPAAAAQ